MGRHGAVLRGRDLLSHGCQEFSPLNYLSRKQMPETEKVAKVMNWP